MVARDVYDQLNGHDDEDPNGSDDETASTCSVHSLDIVMVPHMRAEHPPPPPPQQQQTLPWKPELMTGVEVFICTAAIVLLGIFTSAMGPPKMPEMVHPYIVNDYLAYMGCFEFNEAWVPRTSMDLTGFESKTPFERCVVYTKMNHAQFAAIDDECWAVTEDKFKDMMRWRVSVAQCVLAPDGRSMRGRKGYVAVYSVR